MLFLSKVLPLAVYPLGFALILVLAGAILLILGRRGIGHTLHLVAVLILWLAATPLFATWLYSQLESQYPAVAGNESPMAGGAIVLGGIVSPPAPPRVTLDLSGSFDRVREAASLFKTRRVGAILVSGGNLPWEGGAEEAEANLIAGLLVEMDVPRDAIAIDANSTNTH